MPYRIKCQDCKLWFEANVKTVKCPNCVKRGRDGGRVRAHWADRPGKYPDVDANLFTRSQRSTTKPLTLAGRVDGVGGKDEEKDDDRSSAAKRLQDTPSDASEDDSDAEEREDPNDPEYIPPRDFDPRSRFSPGGSFKLTRALSTTTTKKKIAWIAINDSAGRGNASAQFGGLSAGDHAAKVLTPDEMKALHVQGNPSIRFEWCHMIADSLGGPTVKPGSCT